MPTYLRVNVDIAGTQQNTTTKRTMQDFILTYITWTTVYYSSACTPRLTTGV